MRAARRFLAQCLDAWSVPEPRCDDAVLLVSELVTNATVHTVSTQVVCDVALSTEGELRIEVHDDDHDTRFGASGAPATCAESGRGLLIVRMLARTWGIGPSRVTSGKTVWATLPAQ